MSEEGLSAATQEITPELRAWIAAQRQAGHGPAAILQAMKASGWREDVALAALNESAGSSAAASGQPGHVTLLPDLPSTGHELQAVDRVVQVLLTLDRPRVAVFGNVLSPEECVVLMEQARSRLSRSETVVHATGGSEVNEARTSEGMFFTRGETEVVARLEARLAALVAWPLDHGEGLQVLRYGQGAQYKPHFDYFDPAQAGTAAVLKRGGQRVGTIVVYLNTPEEGGATIFPDAGLSVSPIAGNAVFFNYASPSPDTRTLHGGAPVTRGEKWVATKWLRQGRFE